jgi:hypothetical protein
MHETTGGTSLIILTVKTEALGRYARCMKGMALEQSNSKRVPRCFPTPPPFGSKEKIYAPQAGLMSLKWESFPDSKIQI